MKNKGRQHQDAAELRRQAEETVRQQSAPSPENLKALSLEEAGRLIHELHVHQIELEMQNEDLRQTQVELDVSRARYFNLYDLAPVGYFSIGKQGLIQEVNLTAADLLGEVKRNLVKQQLARFIFREDEDIYYLYSKQLFTTGERLVCELRMRRADAAPFWAQLVATATHDDESGEQVFRIVVSDIDARKQAEAAIQAAQEALLEQQRSAQRTLENINRELNARNRELHDFVQVATHDLRAPLVNIQGFGDLLASACNRARAAIAGIPDMDSLRSELLPLLDGEIAESLEYIRGSSRKMDALLTGLLKMTQMGKAALKIEQLNMNQMLAEIVRSMQFTVERAGVALQVDTLPPCRGDATQINQVFSNLVDNALKYLDPGRPGVIHILGGQKRTEVVYCVEDNGIGIDPGHHEVIFKPFQRLSPDQGSGQGLGLTIVRRVLDRQGGKIWLESTLRQGSKFFVSLPGI